MALTTTFAGVVPPAGLTLSQLKKPGVFATAEKVSGIPELLIVMDWVAGAGPPAAWVKFTIVGATVRLPEDTVKVTGIVVSGLPLLA